MRTYTFSINLGGNILERMQKLQQQYAGFSKLERLAARFKSAFGSASQSVDELRKKLDGLKGKRDLMVGTSQIRRANQEIQQLEGRLNKLQNTGTRNGGSSGSGGSWLGNLARGALPVIGVAGLMAGAGSLATSGMGAEQTKLAYSQFAGDQAAPLYERLNKFANDTSFSNDEILQGGRTLLAAGYNPDSIQPMMKTVGNISAGAGKNFGDMIGSVAKIKQKGFVDGGELHQEFGGTPLMETLKKNLGVDGDQLFKMAEKHQIRYDDLAKAMISMTTGKGIFTGYLEKDMATAKGKLSTFIGNLEYKFQQWGETQNGNLGKLFDFGTEFIDKMGPIEVAVGSLIHAFAPLGETLKSILVRFGLMSEEGTSVQGIINTITTLINIMTTAVEVAASPLGQLTLIFAGLYKGIMMLTTFGIGGMKTALIELWGVMLANPITAILIGLLAVATAFKYAWDNSEDFRKGILTMWEQVKSVFSKLAEIAFDFVTYNWSGIVDKIKSAWAEGTANGADTYAKDHEERFGKIADRRAARRARLGAEGNLSGLGTGGKSGSGTVADKAGLSATTGGIKSTNITLNIKSLVEHLTINANTIQEGAGNMEAIVAEALLRVLGSATASAAAS